MNKFLLIPLLATLIGCKEQTPSEFTEEETNEVTSVDSVTTTPSSTSISFPEYVLSQRDTIVNHWEDNGRSEKILLGSYKTDSSSLEIMTEFSLIPVADGLRGKSRLYVISPLSDTLIFEADDKSSLPVDIYSNHLVFRDQNNSFVFAQIDVLNEEIICFGAAWEECIMR